MKKVSSKKHKFKATIVLIIVLAMSFVFALFAYTNDELKDIYLTRGELKLWASSEREILNNLELNGQQKVQKEVMYQMWIRDIKDEALQTISSSEMQSMEERKRREEASRPTIAPTEPSGGYTKINWSTVTTNSSNWMSNIPNTRYLNEINLPGTHDSGTKTVENGNTMIDSYKAAATCQDKTISEQLNAGVRAFDLRVDESLNICHGSDSFKFTAYESSGGAALTLNTVLTTIKNFLTTNSSETVVISLKVEDGDSSTVAGNINTLLNSYTSDIYTGSTYPQLSAVRGKMVILSRISSLGKGIYYNLSDNTSATKTIDGVSVFMEDHYDATADDKVTHVDNAFAEVENYDIKTDGTKGTHGALIFTSSNTFSAASLFSYQSPLVISQTVNPHITSHSFIQGKTYGYVMMDFVTEVLAKKIYQSNP